MRREIDGWSVDPGDIMRPAEVAALFRVDPQTVTRWAKAGRLVSFTTLGGYYRFSREQVEHLLATGTHEAQPRTSP